MTSRPFHVHVLTEILAFTHFLSPFESVAFRARGGTPYSDASWTHVDPEFHEEEDVEEEKEDDEEEDILLLADLLTILLGEQWAKLQSSRL